VFFFLRIKKYVCDIVAATDRMSDFHEIQNWHSLQEVTRTRSVKNS